MVKNILYIVLVLFASSLISVYAFDPSIYEDVENGGEVFVDSDLFDPSIYELNTNSSQTKQDKLSSSQRVESDQESKYRNQDLNMDSIVRNGFLFMAGFAIIIVVLTSLLLLYSIHYFRKRKEYYKTEE